MSPKVLNVEKLEKKFATLTKSKDSIQCLSNWIIRHKEFYKEIVDRWLDALTRDLNALTMFYVANDVIQNCGRKKAPEFRTAFATVLERAMSLEKIKEIKKEVTRMLTLWHDRGIYDDIFFKKLEDKLNSDDVDPQIEIEDKELPEDEVIASFKLESLINSLRRLKTLEEELNEKESFLEDIEEPGMSNIDNLIVKMESQKELQKFDKFQRLVEDYISLSDKVIIAQKSALLNLKNSTIFYTAQHEDAKKVAHAYRIYGKKVKMVEKSLLEKLSAFPEPSPIFSEKSSDVDLSSNQDLNSPGTSPITTESELSLGFVDKKCSSPSIQIQNLSSAVVNTEKSINIAKAQKSPSLIDLTKSVSNENILRSPAVVDTLKSPNYEKIFKSPVVVDVPKVTNPEKSLKKSPVIVDAPKSTSHEKALKSPVDVEITKCASDEEMSLKTSVDEVMIVKCSDKTAVKPLCSSVENIQISNSLESKVDLPVSEVVQDSDAKKTSNTGSQILSDVDSIDFLLEKAYDDRQVKSKLSFKRKIDNLLKSKQSKSCKLSDDDTSAGNNQDKISSGSELSESLAQSSSFLGTSEVNSGKLSLKSNVSDMKTENINDKVIEKIPGIETVESPDHPMSEVKDAQPAQNMPSSTPLPLQALSDIPTELLKNILDKHRINMNFSNADSSSVSNKTSLATENVDLSDNCNKNLNDSTNTNDNRGSSKISCSNSETSSNDNDKNECNEKLLKDAQNNMSGCIKQSVSCTDSLLSTQKNSGNSTPFLENLQNVLECFTEKEANFEKLKYSNTLSSLPPMPLENTLNVYNCLMQCYNNVDSLSSTPLKSSNNGNAFSGPLSKDTINTESLCSFESKINHNFQDAITVNTDSSSHDKNRTGFKEELNSKGDNLEIMDMEVDSDEDTK